MFTKSFIGDGWHVTPTSDPSEVSYHTESYEKILFETEWHAACVTVLQLNSQLCL